MTVRILASQRTYRLSAKDRRWILAMSPTPARKIPHNILFMIEQQRQAHIQKFGHAFA